MTREKSHRESYVAADESLPLLDTTLGGLMRRNAAEFPDRVALVEGVSDPSRRRRWTYRQFVDEAERLARGLLEFFEPGDRVALLAPGTPEWIIIQHAMSFSGIILVPINPAYTARELGFVLNSSDAVGILFAESSRGKNLRVLVEEVSKSCPNLRHAICVSELDKLLAAGDANRQLPDISPDQIIQMQYTSGTTGFPKGACLHHHGVVNASRYNAMRTQFRDGGVWINAMPLFHISGTIVTQIGTFSHRGTYVIMEEFNPALLLELIESERCEASLLVPTMILTILDHPDLPKRDVSSLRTILSGAANVPAALVKRVHEVLKCKVCIIYGQTEANGCVTITSPDDPVQDQTDTVGRPLPNAEVKIVDPETSQVVTLETVGEIWVRGYQTMVGYHNQPDATAAAITPDGWLRTGDLGTMDSRGYLKITGRLKDMIIRGGMNLYPKEIEDVLFNHPEVSQVAVVGIPNEKWGEIVAAVVIPKNKERLPSIDHLYAYCRANLSPQKTPEQWFLVEQYPLTPSGKIQKHIIQDWIANQQIKPESWIQPARNSHVA